MAVQANIMRLPFCRLGDGWRKFVAIALSASG